MDNDIAPDNAPSNEDVAPQPQPLHVSDLESTPAITTLGLICASMLRNNQLPALMLNRGGYVEIFPPEELALDQLPTDEVLQLLLARGYTDQQMLKYLNQRDDRIALSTAIVTNPPTNEDDESTQEGT